MNPGPFERILTSADTGVSVSPITSRKMGTRRGGLGWLASHDSSSARDCVTMPRVVVVIVVLVTAIAFRPEQPATSTKQNTPAPERDGGEMPDRGTTLIGSLAASHSTSTGRYVR